MSGKGGVGKTTVAAGICLALGRGGYEVLALDCDPDSNLAAALGFPHSVLRSIRPLSALADLIEERTGAKPGASGGLFKLNPHVADIPDAHCYRHGSIKLLVTDAIKEAGGGCACPQAVLIRRLVSEVMVSRSEAVVMDMEAGLEHLGRSTVQAVSSLVTVVDPARQSIGTAQRIMALAADLGIRRSFVLGNRFRSEDDFSALARPHFPAERVLGCIPHDEGIAIADREGRGVGDGMSPVTRQVLDRVLKLLSEEDPGGV